MRFKEGIRLKKGRGDKMKSREEWRRELREANRKRQEEATQRVRERLQEYLEHSKERRRKYNERSKRFVEQTAKELGVEYMLDDPTFAKYLED